MAESKSVTLVDRNGVEFKSDDPGLINSLVMAHGYSIKGRTKLEDIVPADGGEVPVEKPSAKK